MVKSLSSSAAGCLVDWIFCVVADQDDLSPLLCYVESIFE
jgi:hypothetical protein